MLFRSEGGTGGPKDRFAEFRPGAAVISLRTGVPVVPVVIRFRNRRFGLPRIHVIALDDVMVVPEGAAPPAAGSREELALAISWSDALADRMENIWRDGASDPIGSAA